MTIKIFVEKAIRDIGGPCILIGPCCLFYLAFFVRNSTDWFPVEIIYAIAFVFFGTILSMVAISKDRFSRAGNFYRKIKEGADDKNYFNCLKRIWWICLGVLLLLIPYGDGAYFSLPSLVESNLFYFFSHALFLLFFCLSTATVTISRLERQENNADQKFE
ncbi:hypothetical protein [Glaciimonas immobilis]|uniref:Uncharacterized protein n=1 Tax=Glaciimonas immobilis TaxID=728004 RepID=A0A840RTZ8_9BURK|nr:hypothetical protein [Glaciimonas immobilis]KAF3997663.1 hypothetical protein HAV38_13460 [Glaciimonas immobilis]MBB5200622.1 hypothetical protein [Glaciimonas immobilis]